MARNKVPFLALAALLGLGAAYLVLYVEPRRDNLVELDFRRLAAMAERIDMQLATYRQVVANAASAATRPTLPPPLELRAWRPPESKAGAEPAVAIRELTLPGGGWFLFDAGHLTVGVRIEEVVRQALESSPFDKLILATRDGSILHQEGRKDIQLTTLDGLGIEDKPIARISRSTGLHDAALSERGYKVFVQPCASPRVPRQKDRDTSTGWALFALMGSSRFHVRSLEVSANWIILVLGTAVLALLALPFLKLLTIGKGARLRAIDGLLAGLCALIGLSVLTVLLLDLLVYGKLADKEKEQIAELAMAIHRSFTKDLDAALTDFASLRGESAGAAGDSGQRQSEAAGEALARHAAFFWADASGAQTFKWTRSGQPGQRIPVGDRSYFRDSLAGRPAFYRADGEAIRGYTLESIRSWTTGEDQVAIATLDPRGATRQVAVLLTRMSSLHDAVLPPGFGFAVIDAAGRVLFHSERRRMLQENFLDEAGSDELRALAAAGRPGPERVSYKGRKHEVFLQPIPQLEWSVVAFREMSLLRATNVQIVTTTLVCLILYAALFLALFSGVYVASSTRARWLWPLGSRQGSYLQLAVFYAGCLVVFLVLIQDAGPTFLLVNGMIVPLLALFVSYVKVRSDQKLDAKQVGALAAIVVLLAVSLLAGLPELDPTRRRVVLVSLILGGLFLFLPPVHRLFSQWRPAPLQTTYLCTSALLLMVLTILPAASFFKLACDIPIENMLKRGQLALMRQLDSAGSAAPESYGAVFFTTLPADHLPKATPGEPGRQARSPHPRWLLKWQEKFFPVYSEHSQALARLSPDTDEGWLWHWEHRKGKLWLHRHARPDSPARYLVSSFYSVKPQGLAWLGLSAGVLALAVISFGLIRLMSHNLMLLGTCSPLWLDRRKVSLGTSVTHAVYVSTRAERLCLPHRPTVETIDVARLEEEIETGRILKRPVPSGKRLVVVQGFDHRLEERGFNWAKLVLLEELVGHGGRRVVVLSGQDPYLCLAAGLLTGGGDDPEREQHEQERWRQLLDRFAVVDLDGQEQDAGRLREEIRQARERLLADAGGLRFGRLPWRLHVCGCLKLIWEECSATAQLEEIGLELLPDLDLGETSRRELLHEILTRTEGYYEDLWSSLPEDEKVVLLQLAEESLTNPKNLRPLQRLVARGLVRRDPAPRLINETFRLFVFAAAAGEGVRSVEARHEKESTWGQLKVPLTATLLGGIVFFGVTQQEVLKTSLSVMSVTAGLLPHLLQLLGYLGASKAPLPPVR